MIGSADGSPVGGAEAYDEVVYESEPFPETHPERIGAVASLFGLAAPPVATARILEIGCAGGNNILPIAAQYPGARCVGLDRSAKQLSEGIDRARRLGLNNLELRASDIRDPASAEGQYDYIIAHGFFSWVAPPIQERMFEVIAQSLAPDGLAYVSYNTLPGWYSRFPGRELLLLQLEGIRGGAARIAQARKLIAELLRAAHTGTAAPTIPSSLDRALVEQLRFYDKFPDWYLYHDILEGENHPTYLSSFVSRAERHGLAYVGDSDLSRMVPFDLAPEQQRFLRGQAKSDLHLEQLLDFLRAEAFRRTILCRKGRATDRNGALARLGALYFSPLCEPVPSPTPANPGSVMAESDPSQLRFRDRGGREFATESPIVALILGHGQYRAGEVLQSGDAVPHGAEAAAGTRRSLRMLVDEAVKTLDAPPDELEQLVREQLFNLLLSGVVAAHLGAAPSSATVGQYPRTTPLIRDYAVSGPKIVTLVHELLIVDEPARALLCRLDGSKSVAELEGEQPGAAVILESLARNGCLLP